MSNPESTIYALGAEVYFGTYRSGWWLNRDSPGRVERYDANSGYYAIRGKSGEHYYYPQESVMSLADFKKQNPSSGCPRP
jgi:hypothetical protein